MASKFLEYIKAYNADFEPRKEQLEMMDSVDTLIESDTHNALIAEAATGTGKTLASLLPLLVNKVPRIIYCTPNVLLINEIMKKDIPTLIEKLFPDLTATGLIGKDRFCCINRFDEQYPHQKTLKDQALSGEWNQTRDTYKGDIEISDALWQEIKFRGDFCKKDNCPYASNCQYIKMRKEAQDSQLLVTSYSMLFALLESDNELLGNIEDCVFIFDEAHQLPELVKASLQRSFQLSRICKCFESEQFDTWKENTLQLYPNFVEIFESLDNSLDEIIDKIYDFEQTLSIKLSEQSGDIYQSNPVNVSLRLDKHAEPKQELVNLFEDLSNLCGFFNDLLESFREDNSNASHNEVMDKASYYVYLLEQAIGVHELALKRDFEPVDWTKLESKEYSSLVSYEAAPLRLSPFFDQFADSKCIFMSGTLTSLGKLDFFMSELGLKKEIWKPQKLILKSPFNLTKQGELKVYDSLGCPSDEDYIAKLVEALPEMLTDTKAGLMLFNSYKQVNDLEEEMRWRDEFNGITFRFQGEDSRERLIDEHKDDVRNGRVSVLVGLASFGTGLDLPAELLDTVIIGALPFKAVNDPIIAAKCEQMEQRGQNSFYGYTLPCASNTLTQYAGRLIRTSQCRGKVLITDGRILSKKYGTSLLTYLPDFNGKTKYLVANKALCGGRKSRKTSGEAALQSREKVTVF